MKVSSHARQRMAEMDVSPKRVLSSIAADAEMAYPDPHFETRIRIKVGNLVCVVANYGEDDETLVTVMPWSPDKRFVRPEAKAGAEA